MLVAGLRGSGGQRLLPPQKVGRWRLKGPRSGRGGLPPQAWLSPPNPITPPPPGMINAHWGGAGRTLIIFLRSARGAGGTARKDKFFRAGACRLKIADILGPRVFWYSPSSCRTFSRCNCSSSRRTLAKRHPPVGCCLGKRPPVGRFPRAHACSRILPLLTASSTSGAGYPPVGYRALSYTGPSRTLVVDSRVVGGETDGVFRGRRGRR